VSTFEHAVAPRAVDVLPAKATRRVTRRDGLLPLVFVLELLTGVVFGLAANSGAPAASSAPTKLSLAPAAQVTVLPSSAPAYGPAVGPLLPGQVRPPVAVSVTAPSQPRPPHAPRNPFGALVHATA